MKFTLSWLKDYLDTQAPVDEISAHLSSIGLEVEDIHNPAEKLQTLKVALIEETSPHPNADALQICRVNAGSETLTIVCGAPNARPGIKVALAPIGTIVPSNNMVIKPTKIRDVESHGMLCSAKELMLGEADEGIMELPEYCTVGDRFVDAMDLDDPVIDIAITPNRGDCLGVYGIARDLAARGVGTLKSLSVSPIKGSFGSPIQVKIHDKDTCSMFVGRYFKGVKNLESPEWLKKRLIAIGLNPISALVDITNYLCVDLNRPLHVFDANKLKGNLDVRLATKGESFLALNEHTYTLSEQTLVIADEKGPQAIGGIMGGFDSGCTDSTTNVFLEAALFDPIAIAKTSRAYDLYSDSSFRFARSIDPDFLLDGVQIATKLILECCQGEPSDLVIAGQSPHVQRTIDFQLSDIVRLTGMAISETHALQILEKLGCTCTQKTSHLEVIVPSWRSDLVCSADLVEEVARLYGYEHMEAIYLQPPVTRHTSDASYERTRVISNRLAYRGLTQLITWSFTDPTKALLFGEVLEDLHLKNPIHSDFSFMRNNLYPNILLAMKRNLDRNSQDLALFEVGPVFCGTKPNQQNTIITAVRTGLYTPKNHYKTERYVDAYDAKSDAHTIFNACGFDASRIQVTRNTPEYYHPGKSGAFVLGKTILGYFGELHPSITKAFGITMPVVGAELYLDNIPAQKHKPLPPFQCSDYQLVIRDFAFIVSHDTPVGAVVKTIQSADKKLIQTVTIFDIYEGEHIEKGMKSVAFQVTLQAEDRTLTDQEINTLSQTIIDSVGKHYDGLLRQ